MINNESYLHHLPSQLAIKISLVTETTYIVRAKRFAKYDGEGTFHQYKQKCSELKYRLTERKGIVLENKILF